MVFRMVIVKGSAVPRVYLNPKIIWIFQFSWFSGWWSWRDQLSPACTSTQKSFEIFIFHGFSGWWSWRDQLYPACTSTQKSFEIFQFSSFRMVIVKGSAVPRVFTSTQKIIWNFSVSMVFRMVIVKGSAVPRVYLNPKIIWNFSFLMVF